MYYNNFNKYIDTVNELYVKRSQAGFNVNRTEIRHFTVKERTLKYQFYTHFHPYVSQLTARLLNKGVRGFQEADTDYVKDSAGVIEKLPDGKSKPVLYADAFTPDYTPNQEMVSKPFPVKDIDFTSSGAYAVYNWEMFYHIPLAIAISLSKNQRFEEAQKWFHYIFDPTDDSNAPTPQRYWKVRAFQYTNVRRIEEILVNLSSQADPELRKQTINSMESWKDNPFRPHVVARYRQTAYMYKVLMAYLDNLIDWGDSLFKQDTGESINEATQLYVLAANILGPKPQEVPKKGTIKPQTYYMLRKELDEMSNALRALETDIPFNLAPHPTAAADNAQVRAVTSVGVIGKSLYFGVPKNDKLLTYWDTVADRLFKIRNSLNMQGLFRQLPLFEPPIDPGMLVRATAAGLDVAAILNGLNQPLPIVRFQLLLQKATELCQEVKSLGSNLLAAFEKEDNEILAVMRAKHEANLLALAEMVRYAQLQEAIKNREGIEKTLENAFQRYRYYEQLLGKKDAEITLPKLVDLDEKELEKFKLKADESQLPLREIDFDIQEEDGRLISTYEQEELEKLNLAQILQDVGAGLDAASSLLNLIPYATVDGKPLGVGAGVQFGGMNLSQVIQAMASASRGIAGRFSFEASKAAKMGGYARREQDWTFQSNLVAGEMTQTFKQLRAAQIREAIAKKEWKNHQQQIKNAKEVEQFLTAEKNGKKTNVGFYSWMKKELKGLYAQAFQFAFEIARKAERALQLELGKTDLQYIQTAYLGGKEGLLAGEKLFMDLKRMEMAWYELNQREYEITKHISLLQLNPENLIRLRNTGRCTVFLPEELFDMDCPGHYFRRIKTMAVSIPCITGPHTSVNCTLTLLKSSIRKSALLTDGAYVRNGAEDIRFSDHFGVTQSIVTSNAQNDSGMFETNLRDEKLLPFEYAGAVSEWQIQLPREFAQFSFESISDVIFHIRYTAREGGELLKQAALANIHTQIAELKGAGNVRLFSIRHEFPVEWARFKSLAAGQPAELSFDIRDVHFPYWGKGIITEIKEVMLYARTSKKPVAVQQTINGAVVTDQLNEDKLLNGLKTGKLTALTVKLTGKVTFQIDDNSMTDLWMAVKWA